MSDEPKQAIVIGTRDQRGRFTVGNPGGPGPGGFALRVNQFRRTMLAAVTDDDIRMIAQQLVANAKSGDTFSARLVLSYCLGDPTALTKASMEEEQAQALAQVSTYVAALPEPVEGNTQEEQIDNWTATVRADRL